MKNQALSKKLRMLLRPIAWLAVRYSIGLRTMLEALKGAMVDEAVRYLKLEGKPISASSLSVMTGVHRGDVARLIDKDQPAIVAKNMISEVMGAWCTKKAYRERSGKLRALGISGKTSEFYKLVKTVHTSLNPYTVLNELERLGCVERKDNRVKLLSREYVPSGNLSLLFDFLAEDIYDLTRVVAENLENKSAPATSHHLKTQYNRIPKAQIDSVRTWINTKGSAYHQEVREYLAKLDLDSSTKADPPGRASAETVRVGFGSFAIVDLEG